MATSSQQQLQLGATAANLDMYHVACFVANMQGLLSHGTIDDFRVYPDGSAAEGAFTCWITFADGNRQEWRTNDAFELDHICMQVKVAALRLGSSWCPLEGEWYGVDAGCRRAIRTYIRANWTALASYAYESFLTKGQGSIAFLFGAPRSGVGVGRDCFYIRKPPSSTPKVIIPNGWPLTFDPVKQVVFSLHEPEGTRYIVASPQEEKHWPETIWASINGKA